MAQLTRLVFLTGITGSQVNTALGYTAYNGSANPSGFLTSINSSQVTSALGYTPVSVSDTAAMAYIHLAKNESVTGKKKFTKQTTFSYNTSTVAPIFSTQTATQVVGVDGDNVVEEKRVFGGHGLNEVWGALGTAALPTALTLNTEVRADGAGGFDGTLWSSEAQAAWQYVATENWNGTSHGMTIYGNVTPNGSTTLTRSFSLNPDLSAGFAGWLSVGQFATSNTLGYPTASVRGISIDAPNNSASKSVIEMKATGNTTSVIGEIDFDNLSNSSTATYRTGIITVVPAGSTSGNLGGVMNLATKKDNGTTANGVVINQQQIVSFPNYTNNGGFFYGNSTGTLLQSAPITGIVKGNGSSSPTAAASSDVVSAITTAAVDNSKLANSGDNDLYATQLAGGSAKGNAVGGGGLLIPVNTTFSLFNGSMFFQAIHVPVGATLTGIKMVEATAGSYTASAYNGIGLYTVNAGTGLLTLVASSTNNGSQWTTGTSQISIPFFFNLCRYCGRVLRSGML
jgi:hypothetical protein